jgi:hypothetical protein
LLDPIIQQSEALGVFRSPKIFGSFLDRFPISINVGRFLPQHLLCSIISLLDEVFDDLTPWLVGSRAERVIFLVGVSAKAWGSSQINEKDVTVGKRAWLFSIVSLSRDC